MLLQYSRGQLYIKNGVDTKYYSRLLCSAAVSPSTPMSPANVSPKDCMTLLAKFIDPSAEAFVKVRVVKLLSYILCCLCLAL